MDKLVGFMGGNLSYDGLSDISEFERQLTLSAAIFSWDDRKKLELLPLFLKGKARRVFEATNEDTKKDFKSLMKAIKDGCSQPSELLFQEFFQRKPSSGESLSNFASGLVDLIKRASPALGENERLAMVKAQLCLFVPDYLRVLIKVNSSMTWDQLLVALEGSGVAAQSAFGVSEEIKKEEFDINKMEANHIGREVRFNGNCNFCGRFGHKSAFCFKRISQEQNRNRYAGGRFQKSSSYKPKNGDRKNNVKVNSLAVEEDEEWTTENNMINVSFLKPENV